MNRNVRQLARCSLLAALALALSWLEGWMAPLLPLPGFKPGLANLVTLYALYVCGARATLAVLLTRVALGAVFAGNISALLFSLSGGLAALLAMALLRRAKRLTLYGVSIGGAAAHHCAQVLAAVLMLGSAAPLRYLPVLLAVSPLSGALTGFLTAVLLRSTNAVRRDLDGQKR